MLINLLHIAHVALLCAEWYAHRFPCSLKPPPSLPLTCPHTLMQPVKSAPVPQPCAKPTSKPALCAPHSLTLSISSTLMEMESTVSSGRSTPAMMNGHSSAGSSAAKTVAYACCWDLCPQCFSCSPDLAEHIRGIHVDGQRGGVSSRERSNFIDSVCVRGQVFIEQAEKWSKNNSWES